MVDATLGPSYSYPLLLKQLLHTALRTSPRQEIVYRDTVRYDYLTLAARIARLADGLTRLGVGSGHTIGMLDWDSHRYLESYFAVPGIGATLHTVNIRLSPAQMLYTIEHAQDDVLLVHVDFLPLLGDIWSRIERQLRVIVLSDDGVVPPTDVPILLDYEALLETGSPAFALPDFDENTRATIFYTTGTTGLPKGVSFSHRQLVLHTMAVAAALGTAAGQGSLHRSDVYMPITPMFHVHAWGMPFVATMLGIKQVYPGRYVPDTLLGLVREEGVTFSHCVPTLLHMLLSSPNAGTMDLSSWKVIVGGAALSKTLARSALEHGIDVFAGYGMSETCPILTLAQLTPAMLMAEPDAQIDLRTRTGFPIPLVDLQIVDGDMQPLVHDSRAVGEIVVRSPWSTQGYWHDPRSSERLWHGGWLHTGDIGHIDPDGGLQITDRIKDVIKTGGEWVSSLEIEDLLSQHPAVEEVAVIAQPDDRWGERPLAIVLLAAGCSGVKEADLLAHVEGFSRQGIISKWAVPTRILFADLIEKTSVGKLDKKLLRARYLAG